MCIFPVESDIENEKIPLDMYQLNMYQKPSKNHFKEMLYNVFISKKHLIPIKDEYGEIIDYFISDDLNDKIYQGYSCAFLTKAEQQEEIERFSGSNKNANGHYIEPYNLSIDSPYYPHSNYDDIENPKCEIKQIYSKDYLMDGIFDYLLYYEYIESKIDDEYGRRIYYDMTPAIRKMIYTCKSNELDSYLSWGM